jgi:hypothetical protein
LDAVTYGNGRFVAAGIGRRKDVSPFIVSSDGLTWTPAVWTSPNYDGPEFTGIAYGNGYFVAVCPGNTSSPQSWILNSTNGVDWKYQWHPSEGIRAIAYGNGRFVAVGSYTRSSEYGLIYSSPTGAGWYNGFINKPYASISSVAYGAGQFVVLGNNGLYTSADGFTFTRQGFPPMCGTPLVYGQGRFITFGPGGSMFRSGVIGELELSQGAKGQMLGTISGVDGQQFAIEHSSDLGLWNSLTNLAVTNGVGTFSDPSATGAAHQFYRARLILP